MLSAMLESSVGRGDSVVADSSCEGLCSVGILLCTVVARS